MKFSMVCLAACLAAFALCACKQESSTATSEPVQKTGAVRGVVYATGTTSPVSGVQISCAGVKATTSSDGKYLLEKVPIGQQTLTASKSDYEAYSSSVNVFENSETNHTVFLTASLLTTNVSGTVRRSDNSQAISQAKVTVGGQATFTDATGYYQLPNISQGPKAMTVEKEGFISYSTQLFLSSSSLSHHVLLEKGTVWTYGSILSNTIWRLDMSPYLVADELRIGISNTTLTIEAGVVVKFGRNSGIVSQDGVVRLLGTQVQQILLTGSSNSKGHWSGIDCPTVDAEYATLQYAMNGFVTSKLTAKYLSVLNCAGNGVTTNSLNGSFLKISGNGGSGVVGGALNLTYSVIENNSAKGLSGGGSIVHVWIKNNSGIGVDLKTILVAANLRDVLISSNGGGGLNCHGPVTVDSCSILNNQAFGVKSFDQFTVFKNSIISDNSGHGIVADGITITSSNFSGNTGLSFKATYINYFPPPSSDSVGVRNCYIAGNNGSFGSVVDLSTDGSGGQYSVSEIIYFGSPRWPIFSPRSFPNSSIGSKWRGF